MQLTIKHPPKLLSPGVLLFADKQATKPVEITVKQYTDYQPSEAYLVENPFVSDALALSIKIILEEVDHPVWVIKPLLVNCRLFELQNSSNLLSSNSTLGDVEIAEVLDCVTTSWSHEMVGAVLLRLEGMSLSKPMAILIEDTLHPENRLYSSILS